MKQQTYRDTIDKEIVGLILWQVSSDFAFLGCANSYGLQDSSAVSALLMLFPVKEVSLLSQKCNNKHQQSLREHRDLGGLCNSLIVLLFQVDSNEFHSNTNWNRFFCAMGNEINKYGPRKITPNNFKHLYMNIYFI